MAGFAPSRVAEDTVATFEHLNMLLDITQSKYLMRSCFYFKRWG